MPRYSTDQPFVIASRKSPLARVQAEWVGSELKARHPEIKIEHLFVESEGDRFTGRLADAGGKGLFTTSVEALLLDKRADIAVHSMKDMPICKEELTAGLEIIAVPRREEACDVLVARDVNGQKIMNLRDLPKGARIGSASPRRCAQLLRLRPDLKMELLRGNVETRLRKATTDSLSQGGVQATLLAAAGLRRLSIQAGIPIDFNDMLPAASQGALAIQSRSGDHRALRLCVGLNDANTATCAHAERMIVGALGADCHSPVAAFVMPKQMEEGHQGFHLRVRVLSQGGEKCLEISHLCKAKDLSKTVQGVIDDLINQGAREML